MPSLIYQDNPTSYRIKVSNCGYIHLIGVITDFYNTYLIDSIFITQLKTSTFAIGSGEDLIYGISFNEYQIRLTHVCTNEEPIYCSTDEIDIEIYTMCQSKSVKLNSLYDIPPFVLTIYNNLIRYIHENN